MISPFGHVTDLNSSGLQGTSQVIEVKLLHGQADVSYREILLYCLADTVDG